MLPVREAGVRLCHGDTPIVITTEVQPSRLQRRAESSRFDQDFMGERRVDRSNISTVRRYGR